MMMMMMKMMMLLTMMRVEQPVVQVMNLTVSEGQTVHLPCHVKQIGNNNLAWVRSNDSTILSIDTDIVTHDKRFRIVESGHREDWVLIIR